MKKLTSMAWVLPLVVAPAFISGCGPVNADMENADSAKIVEAAPVDMPEQPQDVRMPQENMRNPMMQQNNNVPEVGSAVELPPTVSRVPGTFTNNPTTYSAEQRARFVNQKNHVFQTNIERNSHLHNIHTNTHFQRDTIVHPRRIITNSVGNTFSFSNTSSGSVSVEPEQVVTAEAATYAAPVYGVGYPYYGYGLRYPYYFPNLWAAGLARGCSPLYGNCFAKALHYGFPY